VTLFSLPFINNSDLKLSTNVALYHQEIFLLIHIHFPIGCELFRKPEAQKNVTLINRFAVIFSYITLKVTSLDPSQFYLQRLVRGVLAMPDSFEVQRIRIHETSLMFVITNKATTQPLRLYPIMQKKKPHIIYQSLTYSMFHTQFLERFIKFSRDEFQYNVIYSHKI
jgi:hypothetical protein